MKYFKRANITKNYNGSLKFDHNNNKAYSYDWYEIARIESAEYAILNTYRYSSTTCKHVHQMRSFIINELGISNIVEIEAPKGLQSIDSLIEHYNRLIKDLESQIAKKGTRKTKNIERQAEIRRLGLDLDVAKKLLKVV